MSLKLMTGDIASLLNGTDPAAIGASASWRGRWTLSGTTIYRIFSEASMSSSLISDQLRAAVLAAPLTPYRLAELAAVPRSAISRFLSGKSGLTVDTVDRLCGVLGLRLVQTRRVARQRPKR